MEERSGAQGADADVNSVGIQVHEIFVMDRELKKMTAENRPEWEIEDYVVKTQGMRTMREELADLVCDGVISMEEFLRTVETW